MIMQDSSKETGIKSVEGNFVNLKGEVIGKHKGITHYTVGQRKGLGLAMGHPVFVLQLRPETNEVVIGENEDVFADKLYADRLNFMSVEKLDGPTRVTAKIRYSHAGAPCRSRCLMITQLNVYLMKNKEP